MNPWLILGLLVFAWIATLSGVIVGAYAVFRAKRESCAPFFGMRQSGPGGPINIDEDFDQPEPQPTPEPVANVNDRFVRQFAEGLKQDG